MRFALVIFSFPILISCKNERVQISESEIQEQDFEKRNAMVIMELGKKYQEQSERFKLYLGMKQFGKTTFKSSDTLVTFWHDFSYAASIAGKVCQIFKTDSFISLSEVYYSNRHNNLSNDSGFTFMSFHTGQSGSTVHSFYSSKKNLEVTEWNALMKAFDKECFYHLPVSDSAVVIDGTSTSLSLECQDRIYNVHRRWLEDDSLYRLCKMMDNLTENRLDNF